MGTEHRRRTELVGLRLLPDQKTRLLAAAGAHGLTAQQLICHRLHDVINPIPTGEPMPNHPTTPSVPEPVTTTGHASWDRNPEADAVNEADQHAESAEDLADKGHISASTAVRAGYGAIAQVHATLALHAEVRATRLQIADLLEELNASLGRIADAIERS